MDGTNHECGAGFADAAGFGHETLEGSGAVEGMARAGFAEKLLVPIGILELVCVVVYLIPRTSVLGAILLTGLLGGATVTTLRIGDPTFPMPVILGMMAWGGLYLRDVRLRELIPLQKS